jgi:hypothetical protein
MLYSTLKPFTAGTAGNVNAVAQVLAGATSVGAAGNTTNSLLPEHCEGSGVEYVAFQHPGAKGVNSPEELIVPPPLTAQVPSG